MKPVSYVGPMPPLYHLVKELLEHDEPLSARAVLDAAPWAVRTSPWVEDMKLVCNAQLAHVDDPELYWRMYGAYWAERESIPLPQPVLPEYSQFQRFRPAMQLVTERPGCTFLDVGSYDGWLTNRAGLAGARSFGVDCSVTGVALANAKAAEFNTGAQHALCRFGLDPLPDHFPQQYEVLSCMEVYEHCPDTGALCRLLRSLVAPGGVCLLTTPHGSWLRGLSGTIGYGPHWDCLQPREHVRAPTPEAVRADLLRAGFASVDVTTWLTDQSAQPEKIHGQATLVVVAR